MKEFVECIQKYSNLNQLSVDLMESKVELKVIKKGQYFLKAGKKVSLVLDRYRKIIPHLNNAGLYKFFNYSVNEALFLSEKEEKLISGIFENIRQEYRSSIDKFTEEIIITQIESLLAYAERFYTRQFITRKTTNHQLLDNLEASLIAYFNSADLAKKGFPTVKFISDELHVSPNYLSGLLKVLTERSTQQHIQDKIIDIAKEKLSTSNLSVSEITYELGFGYPQSFIKLFKTKTHLTSLEYRQSFN